MLNELWYRAQALDESAFTDHSRLVVFMNARFFPTVAVGSSESACIDDCGKNVVLYRTPEFGSFFIQSKSTMGYIKYNVQRMLMRPMEAIFVADGEVKYRLGIDYKDSVGGSLDLVLTVKPVVPV